MYKLIDYDFKLPEELISHAPEKERETSRLLHIDRQNNSISHNKFSDIIDLLEPSDVLVINNTKVIPARLNGFKETGGKVEVLIIDYIGGMEKLSKTSQFECECLIKSSKRPKDNSTLTFGDELTATVLSFKDGIYLVRFSTKGDFNNSLDKAGKMPLPPYIKRDEEAPCDDKITYQTVYATEKGAVAAPTAGLHFTGELLEKIRAKNIEIVTITLHVGYGTFVPVRVDDIRDHQIHTERFYISEESATTINNAKKTGNRIIAVGTTTVRTLEYSMQKHGEIKCGHGDCDLFIYPGYDFTVVGAMITNFHIPQSTLLMLVSAFAGRKTIFEAYELAVAEGYRFYSYGDSMFIT